MLDNVFYMYSDMDSGTQILVFLIILVGLMLTSILIINHITKKRNEKYNNRFHRIDKYSNFSKDKKVKRSILNVEKIEDNKEKLNTISKNEEKVKIIEEEIEKLEEPEVIEIISDDSSIDKISSLIEDNINNPKPIDLTTFEEEEEKNAIISYDELVKRAGAKKIVYKTDAEKIKEEPKTIKENIKGKFKASQIISPIYGIQKEENKKGEIEEFIDVDNIPLKENKVYEDEELQKDITFLTSLKAFRSNLD